MKRYAPVVVPKPKDVFDSMCSDWFVFSMEGLNSVSTSSGDDDDDWAASTLSEEVWPMKSTLIKGPAKSSACCIASYSLIDGCDVSIVIEGILVARNCKL